MKRVTKVFLGLALVSIFAMTLVSAKTLTELTTSFFQGVYDVAKPILELLTGTSAPTAAAAASEIFYIRLLAMLIVFAVTYAALKTTDFFKGWPLWLISIVVPILGVRFLKDQWLYTILVPQSTFAVAVTAGLPFVLFFFVIRGIGSQTVRRIAWIFFGVIMLAMWSYYSDQLNSANYVYPLTAILALIMVIMDGTITHWWNKMKLEKQMSTKNYIKYTKLLKEREDTYDAYLQALKSGDAAKIASMKTAVENLDSAIQALM